MAVDRKEGRTADDRAEAGVGVLKIIRYDPILTQWVFAVYVTRGREAIVANPPSIRATLFLRPNRG